MDHSVTSPRFPTYETSHPCARQARSRRARSRQARPRQASVMRSGSLSNGKTSRIPRAGRHERPPAKEPVPPPNAVALAPGHHARLSALVAGRQWVARASSPRLGMLHAMAAVFHPKALLRTSTILGPAEGAPYALRARRRKIRASGALLRPSLWCADPNPLGGLCRMGMGAPWTRPCAIK